MPVRSWSDIHGWFFWEDVLMFQDILGAQAEPGTLVELGAFLGRSTALMGHYRRPGEDFVVVDLFGLEPEDGANAAENTLSYSNVPANELRARFEANYAAVHDVPPTVVQAPSTAVAEHVGAGEVRFVHIDASHLYQHVAADIDAVRPLLRDDGVVVLDDYRAVHTPGVAAAAWEAVAAKQLVPFALTPYKMYATWGDPVLHGERAWRLGQAEPEMDVSRQSILGHDVVRLEKVAAPKPATSLTEADLRAIADRLSKQVAAQVANQMANQVANQVTVKVANQVANQVAAKVRDSIRAKRSRSDWAPPVLVEWVRARRRRRA